METEGGGKKESDEERERGSLHHEWNRNDAPLGSISEPLHTMAASTNSKCGNNAEPSAYDGREIKVVEENTPLVKSSINTHRLGVCRVYICKVTQYDSTNNYRHQNNH